MTLHFRADVVVHNQIGAPTMLLARAAQHILNGLDGTQALAQARTDEFGFGGKNTMQDLGTKAAAPEVANVGKLAQDFINAKNQGGRGGNS